MSNNERYARQRVMWQKIASDAAAIERAAKMVKEAAESGDELARLAMVGRLTDPDRSLENQERIIAGKLGVIIDAHSEITLSLPDS